MRLKSTLILQTEQEMLGNREDKQNTLWRWGRNLISEERHAVQGSRGQHLEMWGFLDGNKGGMELSSEIKILEYEVSNGSLASAEKMCGREA